MTRTEIMTTGTKAQVLRIEATPDEVEQVFNFTEDGEFIGSEWRLKEVKA